MNLQKIYIILSFTFETFIKTNETQEIYDYNKLTLNLRSFGNTKNI